MKEKLNEHGQVASIEDAWGLATLENDAREAEAHADLVGSAAGGDTDEPSDVALGEEGPAYEEAAEKRARFEEALEKYMNPEN